MMQVQAGPSSHHQFQSVSGTGAPTFISGAAAAAATGGGPFHSISQADLSSYPGFAPAMMPHPQIPMNTTLDCGFTRKPRKRKAESQDNERLSKRLSLLNLEQNGNKLYVPVESPHLKPSTTTTNTSLKPIPEAGAASSGDGDDSMQLDDTKHKVYIYNLDDELSSDGESSADEGRLLFLPDIEKHLLQTRIPPHVLASPEGELAGVQMQVVLYREPASLTVPEEQDSVRRAVIEARHRLREKQRSERGETAAAAAEPGSSASGVPVAAAPTTPYHTDAMSDDDALPTVNNSNSSSSNGYVDLDDGNNDNDPDAMEMD